MYDRTSDELTTTLQSSQPTVFSDDTIEKILALTTSNTDTHVSISQTTVFAGGTVTIPSGTDLAYLTPISNQPITVSNAPVVVFNGLVGANATFNDGTSGGSDAGHVDRVIVGGAGSDKIVIADAKNTQVTIGNNDTVYAGSGADTVIATGGNSTIVGSTGGSTVVKLSGNASDYTVTVDNGHAIVTGGTHNILVDNVHVISGSSANDNLLIASNADQAAIMSLYQAALGHGADATTLAAAVSALSSGHATLASLTTQIMATAEYQTETSGMNDNDFVQMLYQHTFGRAGEDAGVAYWTDALTNHAANRADLIRMFSEIGAHSRIGDLEHNEAQVIGSVTIVHNIV
ncbi:MAG TPA: DUF4214 domain-containing protein [Telluria sp.]|nr:DUF4214 domain-containing protein [Telluria sp.]